MDNTYRADVIINGKFEQGKEMPRNRQHSYKDLHKHFKEISMSVGIQLIYNTILYKYLIADRYVSFIKGCNLSTYEVKSDRHQHNVFDSDAHKMFSVYVNAGMIYRNKELDTRAVIKLLGSTPFPNILRITKSGLSIVSNSLWDSESSHNTMYLSRCCQFNVRSRKNKKINYESGTFSSFLENVRGETGAEISSSELEQVGAIEIVITDQQISEFTIQVASAIEKYV
jgi:hypothetical protein